MGAPFCHIVLAVASTNKSPESAKRLHENLKNCWPVASQVSGCGQAMMAGPTSEEGGRQKLFEEEKV